MATFNQVDLEKIYEEFVEEIYKFFSYKFLNKQLAEDLTSQTFMRFVDKVKQDEVIREPRAYLYGLAKYIYLEELRAKYQLEQVELDVLSEQVTAVNMIETVEVRDQQTNTLEDIAMPFISKLPEKQAQVIEMRLIQKMTVDDVCQELDVNSRYVRTTQNRAINNLKKIVATEIIAKD